MWTGLCGASMSIKFVPWCKTLTLGSWAVSTPTGGATAGLPHGAGHRPDAIAAILRGLSR